MTFLGDQPFRMPDSWYDPPDERDWVTCPECNGDGTVPDEDNIPEQCAKCDGNGEVGAPDKFEDPDPDRAYEEMRDRRFEEG